MAAGQGCRARLPGKAAGQGCRERLHGKGAICSIIVVKVWTCLDNSARGSLHSVHAVWYPATALQFCILSLQFGILPLQFGILPLQFD
jgi:hypothetical protein